MRFDLRFCCRMEWKDRSGKGELSHSVPEGAGMDDPTFRIAATRKIFSKKFGKPLERKMCRCSSRSVPIMFLFCSDHVPVLFRSCSHSVPIGWTFYETEGVAQFHSSYHHLQPRSSSVPVLLLYRRTFDETEWVGQFHYSQLLFRSNSSVLFQFCSCIGGLLMKQNA